MVLAQYLPHYPSRRNPQMSSTTRLQDPACYPGTGIFSVASLSNVCIKTVSCVCCPSTDGYYCQVVLCMQAVGMTLVDPMELPAEPAYLTSTLRGFVLFCTTNSVQATTTSIHSYDLPRCYWVDGYHFQKLPSLASRAQLYAPLG